MRLSQQQPPFPCLRDHSSFLVKPCFGIVLVHELSPLGFGWCPRARSAHCLQTDTSLTTDTLLHVPFGLVVGRPLQGGYLLGPMLRRRPVRSPLFALLVRVHVHHALNHDRAVHLPLWAMSRTSSSLLDDFITLTWAVSHEQGPHQRPHCTLLFFFPLLSLLEIIP